MHTSATSSVAKRLDSNSSTGFQPAVLGTPGDLTAEARKRIIELSGARPVRFWSEMGVTWAVVATTVVIGAYVNHWAMSILCILVIATRQMVLALLLHEQVHRLGSRSTYGDWLVNIFVGYPLLVTTVEDYASVHLSHHKYFMTKKDPDFIRKSGPDWNFPTNLKTILGIIARDLTGLNTVALIRGKKANNKNREFVRKNPSPLWLRLGTYLITAAVLTVVGGWTIFLLYWVLPLLTVTQLFVRWIAVIEHKYDCEGASVHEITPLIKLKWWQKIIFPDLNFAMHVYHHMHPGVSFSNLPKVHEIYKANNLVNENAIFDGQGEFVRYLVGKQQ